MLRLKTSQGGSNKVLIVLFPTLNPTCDQKLLRHYKS
jgi:hypothetical protein